MPSALQKFTLLFILFIGAITFFASSSPAYALGIGESCNYPEQRKEGLFSCKGKGKFTDGAENSVTCQYDDSIGPICEKVPTSAAPTSTDSPGPQGTNPNPSANPASGTPVKADNWFAEEQSAYTVTNMEFGFICELTKISTIPSRSCPARNAVDGKLALYQQAPGGGAFGSLASVMGSMYDSPPISSTQYLAHLGENMGLVRPAYAQVTGSGSNIIQPVLKLWQIMRNVAYMGFILIFISVGFMIMFRRKINPQTVISVQAALPGLVVGLIMVTFSYFIAALLVDISFVGMKLVAEIFIQSQAANYFGDPSSGGSALNADNLRGYADKSDLFSLFSSAAFRPSNISEITSFTFNTVSDAAGGVTSALIPSGIIRGVLTTMLLPGIIGGTALAGVGSAIIGLIIPLILLIALFVQFFRLLFGLIFSYIQILIMTLAGPILILYSSIPGNGGAMTFWWKTILANALIFPLVFAVFLLAGMILVDTSNWTAHPPLFGGTPTSILRIIIAYGLMLGTPAIPDMVRGLFKVQFPPQFAKDAMGGLTAGQGIATSFGKAAINRSQLGGLLKARHEYQQNLPLAQQGEGKAQHVIEGMDNSLRNAANATGPGRYWNMARDIIIRNGTGLRGNHAGHTEAHPPPTPPVVTPTTTPPRRPPPPPRP